MYKKIRPYFYMVVGHTFLAIGVIGVFVPLLPTTPFVILAAFCYERGSPRFHAWLLENRYVGPHIRNWKEKGSIPLRAKVIAVTMITTSIGWIVYAAPLMAVKIGMALVGVSVSGYIISRPNA